jgi:hypothetical protein
MNGFAFDPLLDRSFRRKKLDIDLDLRKIAESLDEEGLNECIGLFAPVKDYLGCL